MFAITAIITQGYFNGNIRGLIQSLYKKNFWNKLVTACVGIQHFHKLHNTAFAVKFFWIGRDSIFFFFPEVGEFNTNSTIQESQLTKTTFQNFFIINGADEDASIRPEMNFSTGGFTFTNFTNRILRNTDIVFLLENFSFTVYFHMQFCTQSVHAANADTVQTARYFVSVFIKLTTGMQHRHNDFQRRFFFFAIDARWNTTSVIFNRNGIVLMNNNGNIFTIAGKSFIDWVINYLVNEMMQTFHSHIADVHGRSFTNRFQTF